MRYLLVLIIALACVTLAIADRPANHTYETQGLATHTDVTVAGLFTEADSVAMQGATGNLDNQLAGPGLATAIWRSGESEWRTEITTLQHHIIIGFVGNFPFQEGDIFYWNNNIWDLGAYDTPGEVQYTSAYTETTSADSGYTTYTKSMDVDTRNMVLNQENIKAEKVVSYVGSPTGRIISDESILLDTAGNFTRAEGAFLCPFAADEKTIFPQFCNIVQAGSTLNMRQVNLVTSASDRFISGSADVPVEMDYTITVNGPGSQNAIGDVAAYMNAHTKEGRMTLFPGPDYLGHAYRPELGSDLTYSEKTTASGVITLFQKKMGYTSGVRRV